MTKETAFDVIVIGGGITGAGVFREAVARGFKTLLVEANSPGGKTTAISSGLIHGGLRYVPYDFETTRICCHEAGRLKGELGDFLKQQIFLWPVYSGQRFSLELVEALLECYDSVSALKQGKQHVRLNLWETLELEPALNPRGLEGAITFDEWSVDAVALVQHEIDAGVAGGGVYFGHTKVVGFSKTGQGIAAVAMLCDHASTQTIGAKVVVNATGPWADRVARLAGVESVRLTLRKGVHLIVARQDLRYGVLFRDIAGRYLGAYPRDNEVWLGPTDDPFDGSPDDLDITEEEKQRLIQSSKWIFPHFNFENPRFVVGVRPLIFQQGIGSLLTRDYRVYDHEKLDGVRGFFTVTGGKMTIFGIMAQETMDAVSGYLNHQKVDNIEPRHSHRSSWFNFIYSLVQLCFFGLRHFIARSLGRKRDGIALFRETYDVKHISDCS